MLRHIALCFLCGNLIVIGAILVSGYTPTPAALWITVIASFFVVITSRWD